MGSTEQASIEIKAVATRGDRNAFVRFPWQIYRGDPHWIPPLLTERKDFISRRKHPFYRHGDAAQLLASHQGRIVGRVQVSDDPHYNAEHSTNLGHFGLFECTDDPQVANALLDAAAAWLVARGRNRIMGPVDYSTNYSCGLLVDGFETPPRVMMNHNPPYYLNLLENWGLSKGKDMYSWWFEDPSDAVQQWRKKAGRLAARCGVTVRSLNPRDFHAELMRVKSIYNEAWVKNWGFVKLSESEIHHFGRFLAALAVPEMLLLAEVKGVPAGISLTLPDLNEALRPLDGRLTRWGFPIGYLKFRAGIKRIKACRLFTLGVTERFRRRGVMELLILQTLDYGKNTMRYTGAELGWTLEDNQSINRAIAAVGAERYKTYRIYEKAIA